MKGSDKTILLVIPVLALAIGFYMLVISPKRSEISDLDAQIATLQSSIDEAEGQIAVGEAARDAFPQNYSNLVAWGKAVPEDGDQSTLIYDISRLGRDNSVEFRDFALSAAAGETPAPAPAPAPEATEPPAEGETEEAAPVATTDPAAATEATAATLPIGATVGSAGLPVMPYDFKFLGNFFDMADFFADIDGMVTTKGRNPETNGRLMTIDGFSLTGDEFTGFPNVEANFAITTYLVPEDQGLSAGASPAGPAPTGTTEATPISTPTGTVVP
jgi:Tfp pilus assembly protein PilO